MLVVRTLCAPTVMEASTAPVHQTTTSMETAVVSV